MGGEYGASFETRIHDEVRQPKMMNVGLTARCVPSFHLRNSCSIHGIAGMLKTIKTAENR